MREVIREVNKDYNNRLEEIKQTPHDEIRTEERRRTGAAFWLFILPRTSQDIEPADDIEMSEAQKELLKTIFWDMNELSAHTEPDGAKVQTYTIAPTMVPWDPSDPTRPTHPSTPTTPPSEPEQPVTLVITMTGKTAAARLQNWTYQLTAEQRSHMEEMLRQKTLRCSMRCFEDIPYISGAVVDGWAYPLPEEGTITEYYGMRVHPITGAWVLHQGLDIGVAEGTPIFAVRAGIVTTATYNDSAGNYVTIDHADGFRSIYMHMAVYIVSAGQEVAAGQVIGYVGSTGNPPARTCTLAYPTTVSTWTPRDTSHTRTHKNDCPRLLNKAGVFLFPRRNDMFTIRTDPEPFSDLLQTHRPADTAAKALKMTQEELGKALPDLHGSNLQH